MDLPFITQFEEKQFTIQRQKKYGPFWVDSFLPN
jgi:hypothetical protein